MKAEVENARAEALKRRKPEMKQAKNRKRLLLLAAVVIATAIVTWFIYYCLETVYKR
ncbi:MAG: hypothetical protein V1834_00420 [Candidatus Micrarchaeota archaeon]